MSLYDDFLVKWSSHGSAIQHAKIYKTEEGARSYVFKVAREHKNASIKLLYGPLSLNIDAEIADASTTQTRREQRNEWSRRGRARY